MFLDDVSAKFAELKDRIETFRTDFSQSEAMTRYGLVNPVLSILGWALEDPSVVVPEYRAGKGSADYALFGRSRSIPLALVEAKSLDTPLEPHLAQAITYCNEQGVKYFAITDGRHWRAYETFRPVPNAEKLVVHFRIDSSEPAREIFNSLWLWRGNFEGASGPVQPPGLPVGLSEPAGGRAPIKPTRVKDATRDGWWALPDVLKTLRSRTGYKPPTSIRFPDGTETRVDSWRGIQPATVQYLNKSGRLTESVCPVSTSRGSFIIALTPVKNSGARFKDPAQIGEFWVDLHWSAKNQVRLSIEALRSLDADPMQVLAKWDPQSNGGR